MNFSENRYEDEGVEPSPIIIPIDQLKPDVIDAVIQEFILREGTDYGMGEFSLEDKKEQVLKQLKAGKVKITFDPKSETCSLVPASH